MFAGSPWGELWATRAHGEPPFEERDERFLLTVAGQIAAAVGRAELFSRMAELAFEDPLTGVANRRALDERLEEAVEQALGAGQDLAVLLCDVDNLKELNDRHGHSTGDEALVRVAGALREAAGDAPGVLVARIGGDEFGVLLEGARAEDAQALGERVLALLSTGESPAIGVSCGVAALGAGARRAGDLLRSADAAQYTAKRAGRGRVVIADLGLQDHFLTNAVERRTYRRSTASGEVLDVGALLERAMAALDGPLAQAAVLERLEVVAMAVADAVDATAVALSCWTPGRPVDTVFSADRRTARAGGERYGTQGELYDIADYPVTERAIREGGSFRIATADPDADPAEVALLASWGMEEVLAAGAAEGDGGWLVEIYADGRTGDLGAADTPLRLLVGEAVRGAHEAALRSVG